MTATFEFPKKHAPRKLTAEERLSLERLAEAFARRGDWAGFRHLAGTLRGCGILVEDDHEQEF